jgi:hypothetical protein
LAVISAVTGTLMRDILVAEGWRVTGGKTSGPSGATVTLEKPEHSTPIKFPLSIVTDKQAKAICRYARISPERFEHLRRQLDE